MMAEMCCCGLPLHYTDPGVENSVNYVVARQGPFVRVTVNRHTYLVPRHYIALHGLVGKNLDRLAARYGWEQVP